MRKESQLTPVVRLIAFHCFLLCGILAGGREAAAGGEKAAVAAGVASDSPDTTSLREGPLQAADPAPLKLLIGVNEIYCKKTACACVHHVAKRAYEPLQKRLQVGYNTVLELRYYEEIFDLHKDVKAGKLDGALAKPWSILKHARESGRNYLRIADLTGPDGASDLRGVVLTKRDSPIRDWPDVKGKRLAMGDSDGYEKSYAALALLKGHGIVPSPAQRIEFSGCIESIGAVLDGKADVAVISDYAFDADCLVDIAKKEDFRVLGQTDPPIPQTSLLLDVDRVPRIAAWRLQRALVELAGNAELRESLLGNGFVRPAPWSPAELPPLPAKNPTVSPTTRVAP
jgi:ABC-type phosphate/phosphonate transport system substrate-binding protein